MDSASCNSEDKAAAPWNESNSGADGRKLGSRRLSPYLSSGSLLDEERRQGVCTQEHTDGSMYEGEFMNGLKHGQGKYTWSNGEYHEGSYYKDYRHGAGVYGWPTGQKFIGKFYLDKREGYGKHLYPDGTTFQGLYRQDNWFGPGVVTYPDQRQDVGVWVGHRLLKLCSTSEEGFNLTDFPEYAAFMDPAARAYSLSEPPCLSDFKVYQEEVETDEKFIYPPGMERFSTNGDYLPLPPTRRKELDLVFFGDLYEPDPYRGHKRDPLDHVPLMVRLRAHIHRHRLFVETQSWNVAAVLSLKRKSFAPKGPLEIRSEELIHFSARGDLQAVQRILKTGSVRPDVSDSRGYTALIAATVNCQNDVIHLLLDQGADIDMLNSEGMSALAICHVLYYPFHFLYTALIDSPQPHEKVETQEQSPDSAPCADSSALQVIEEQEETQDREESPEESRIRRTLRLTTLKLLLDRGADPNICTVPMPVIFLAVMAGDPEAVRMLLLCGAHTDIPLPPERLSLYPLHIAAALPGPAGPKMVRLLLCAVTDPDAHACDQDDVYELDKAFIKTHKMPDDPCPNAGGRTALHVACLKLCDYQNASEVVTLLMNHRGRSDLLWSGHSPLSLAIASGNEQAVAALLKGGANPNLRLGWSVGSALCALANINYPYCTNRTKLLDLLAQAGTDILIPVKVGEVTGTAVDFAHESFNQDERIATTPFHALNRRERETFIKRRQLLSKMGDLLRETAAKKEAEALAKEEELGLTDQRPLIQPTGRLTREQQRLMQIRQPMFKFCYHCARSVSVRLTACSRCLKVYYCSTACKLKGWKARHKYQCQKEANGEPVFPRGANWRDCPLPTVPVSVKLKAPGVCWPLMVTEKELANQITLKENYSCNYLVSSILGDKQKKKKKKKKKKKRKKRKNPAKQEVTNLEKQEVVNLEEQEDELLALLSIFGPEVFVRKESSPAGEIRVSFELPGDFTVTRTQEETVVHYELSHLPPLILTFTLPEDYPQSSAPSFTLACSWLTPSQLSALSSHLSDLYLSTGGAVVLFSWVQFLREDALSFLGVGTRLQLPVDELGPNSNNSDSLKSNSASSDSAPSCGAGDSAPSCGAGDSAPSLSPSQTLLSQLLIYNADEQQRQFSSSLFECAVCLSSRLGSECVALPECRHIFCRPCLAEFCKVQILGGNVRGVTCPEPSCQAAPTPAQVKSLVGEELFSRYDRLLLQSTLDLMSDVTYCPRPSCGSPVIVEKWDSALCSVCAFAFCLACRKTSHGTEDCRAPARPRRETEAQGGDAELPQSEVGLQALRDDYMSGSTERRRLLQARYGRRTLKEVLPHILSVSWTRSNTKLCPHCFTKIQKDGGCSVMNCTRCHQMFCWICLSRLHYATSASHFRDGPCPHHVY